VSFCTTSAVLPWPAAEEGDSAGLTCQTPTITGQGAVFFEGGLKTMRARLVQEPSGTGARLAIYGLDANQFVVCEVGSVAGDGFVFANCPLSAESWITRIEN
jgi:hypothetical protein